LQILSYCSDDTDDDGFLGRYIVNIANKPIIRAWD